MIDLILISAIGGAFYGGFKLGNKYQTLRAAWDDLTTESK
jgi:hypothetical protein